MTPDQKLQAFETLMGELSAALADLVATAKGGQAPMEEVASGIADLVGLMEKRREQPIDELVAAVRGLRIEAPPVNVTHEITVNPTPVQIQNNVQPAPVHVEIVQPDPKGATWEVTIPGRYGAEDRVMTIKRIN